MQRVERRLKAKGRARPGSARVGRFVSRIRVFWFHRRPTRPNGKAIWGTLVKIIGKGRGAEWATARPRLSYNQAVLTDEDKQWMKEQLERVETTLLTEFHEWASPVEMRQRSHAAAIRALDAEVESLSDRLKNLEGH